jgi:peptide/nickel transport system permease protein
MIRRLIRHAFVLFLALIIGGFIGCLLLRYAPGYDSDERDLDYRYTSKTRDALRRARAGEQNIFQFYGHYLEGAVHGDFGVSRAFERPVGELIASRAPITLRLVGLGLLLGWVAGLTMAIATSLRPRGPVLLASELLAGFFLCFPAAILALFVFLAKGPVALVIGGAIFPRVYRCARALLSDAMDLPCVLAAATRGIPRSRIFFRYAVPPTLAPLIAYFGVCVTLAFGAALPVEAICDIPGIGHLAWKAATGRDLPLLTALTLLITAITLVANSGADIATVGLTKRVTGRS